MARLNLGVANDIIRTCDDIERDAQQREAAPFDPAVNPAWTVRRLNTEVMTLARLTRRLAEHARG
jgi:hypothetical protein